MIQLLKILQVLPVGHYNYQGQLHYHQSLLMCSVEMYELRAGVFEFEKQKGNF